MKGIFNNIVFLALRRMRQPLLTLITVYSVAVLGLVLIPGQDADGNVWHMGFFHAFYVVSYMATTIGFGEIPYEFTDGQRLWVTFSLYAGVVSWLYAIGTILSLVQNRAFQAAILQRRFAKQIRDIRQSFYLVCGYGETGEALIRSLTEHGHRAVVIDADAERIGMLRLQNLPEYVPALNGDARRPQYLLDAGLGHPYCKGVVALTNSNEVNLKIAIVAKLLHPRITVICRADFHDVEDNMASFGTDHIIDPYDTFAAQLDTLLKAPGRYLLQRWLTDVEGTRLVDPTFPPLQGRWVICGFGRFGKAVYGALAKAGIEPVVIEATPDKTGLPPGVCVKGRGTEALTLREAGIEQAVALVAGTDDDANNLSIVMTARAINPELFLIARQNHEDNGALFERVQADIVMHPSTIIAARIRMLLDTPLLYSFIELAGRQDDDWACELISRVTGLLSDQVPTVQALRIGRDNACAVYYALGQGREVNLGALLMDSRDRQRKLGCIVLMLERNGEPMLLPDDGVQVRTGDKLLICGEPTDIRDMRWTLSDPGLLEYVLSGSYPPRGWLWRRLKAGT